MFFRELRYVRNTCYEVSAFIETVIMISSQSEDGDLNKEHVQYWDLFIAKEMYFTSAHPGVQEEL